MSRKGIPILDFDDLILALQDLAAPSATDVAVSTANMHYITEDDAQGALAELDAEAYAINSSLTQLQGTFHDGGEKTCEVNTSGLLNLTANFSIPANARDINVVVINDTAVATGAVYWTNSQWYVFILVVGTGNTIERRPSTSTKVRCTWRTP